jgi:hypothetical protein
VSRQTDGYRGYWYRCEVHRFDTMDPELAKRHMADYHGPGEREGGDG